MAHLGVYLWDEGDPEEGKKWLLRAVEVDRQSPPIGRPTAMYIMGVACNHQGNSKEAGKWFKEAADAGDATAMHELGLIAEEEGRIDVATKWFLSAANAGHVDSMVQLGLYEHLSGNLEEATKWLRLAGPAGQSVAKKLKIKGV